VRKKYFLLKLTAVRQVVPTWFEWVATGATALLLILSFPNFELSYLAWAALVPLLVVVARRPSPPRAFLLGWAVGTVFFYATCHWLTYSMIHYGGLPTVVAYLLLVPPAIVVGLFPGLAMMLVALAIKRWGILSVLLAPVFWTAFEWVRLGVTGQLWNALGYSQAFHSLLLGPATWGGVYAVSFLIVLVNAAVALAILARGAVWAVASAFAFAGFVAAVILFSWPDASTNSFSLPYLNVVALQPNVPMTAVKSVDETNQLIARHQTMSTGALKNDSSSLPRLVVWPESPMNFTYSTDGKLRTLIADFTKTNRTSLLLNSLEPAPDNGSYNSALLVNEEGRLIAQYDKIRLMPFGEYVPLPQWLPGSSLITGLVGEFTPGENYTLMPVADRKVGVFICIESAYPWIARRLTAEGADVLINISNDGYLGPTAVMRQHLANAIFRAVENGRPLLRVTNTGLSAQITAGGDVLDQTGPFQAEVRNWQVGPSGATDTFYTKHGDLFVQICAALTAMLLVALFVRSRRSFSNLR
jgi:apolipoprotein N-acyltransferase